MYMHICMLKNASFKSSQLIHIHIKYVYIYALE